MPTESGAERAASLEELAGVTVTQFAGTNLQNAASSLQAVAYSSCAAFAWCRS